MQNNKPLRVLVDLDDTLLSWTTAHESKFHCCLKDLTSDEITKQVEECKYDKVFWSNLPLLERPDFLAAGAVTRRINPKSYTRDNLAKVGITIKRIYQIPDQITSKAKYKRFGDVLIDDSWFNVQQCLADGMPALLITRPSNKHIDTKYRVDHLKYKEIEKKYNELFRV